MGSATELRIRLVARKLPFNTYRMLAEWLGCYVYILPSERTQESSKLFAHWLWIDQVETTLTREEQESLCQILK